MLELLKLAFSHADIMQISKELLVLKDIKMRPGYKPSCLKNDIWLMRYSRFTFTSGHFGFMQMSLLRLLYWNNNKMFALCSAGLKA